MHRALFQSSAVSQSDPQLVPEKFSIGTDLTNTLYHCIVLHLEFYMMRTPSLIHFNTFPFIVKPVIIEIPVCDLICI